MGQEDGSKAERGRATKGQREKSEEILRVFLCSVGLSFKACSRTYSRERRTQDRNHLLPRLTPSVQRRILPRGCCTDTLSTLSAAFVRTYLLKNSSVPDPVFLAPPIPPPPGPPFRCFLVSTPDKKTEAPLASRWQPSRVFITSKSLSQLGTKERWMTHDEKKGADSEKTTKKKTA